ncbi:MAG: phosphate transporter, ATPase subunit [Firmicutes bacterium]|nr:phosphate transporter, ATPase subunit [Bacillota bacterium]
MDYKIHVNKLKLYYGDALALKKISLGVEKNSLLALIGPSGCGKSTFIKTLNRMNDLIANVKIEGEVLLDGVNIYHPDTDVVYTIVMVTHNMQQAARVSDYTAFFLNGDLVEHDQTDVIFTRPQDKRTEDYITGRFG